MIGFQPKEIPVGLLDPGAGLRQCSQSKAPWLKPCHYGGWHCTGSFAMDLILTFSLLWAALSFKNAALGKSYSRFRWGCVPALSYTAPSGVSKENFTQKELNFPEAGMLVALPFLQHSHTGVGSLMAKMDINCHNRTLPWLTWCYSTSSDVLLDGISLVRGYNLVQCRHWKIKQINPNLFFFFLILCRRGSHSQAPASVQHQPVLQWGKNSRPREHGKSCLQLHFSPFPSLPSPLLCCVFSLSKSFVLYFASVHQNITWRWLNLSWHFNLRPV